MARNLSSLTVTQPASDPNIDEAGTFTFEVTPGFAGGGGVNAYDLDLQYDQGTSTWVTIPASSGGLTTNGTAYYASTAQDTSFSITVTGVTADVYSIRALNTSRAVTSATQTVTVNVAAAIPNLSLPTEASITGTTATVGCTTDQGDGTLYFYVSTSATAPTAANLKDGTGTSAGMFGNQASPGTGIETFPVTGLSQSTAYYTYFIHNNASGDSTILESGVWYTQEVLTADNLDSVSNVDTATIGQEHKPLADDLDSTTNVLTVAIGQEHKPLADNLDALSQLSQPTVVDVPSTANLLADNLDSASNVSQPAVAETLQLLVPDADTTVGNWTTHTGSATNLYQQIDEDSANDSDFIQSEPAPSASVVKFGLSNGSPTPTADDTQRVRYRYSKDADDGVSLDLTVSLVEGASTVIASWTHVGITTTLTTANQVLTAPQKASITDYDNLFIQFEASI